MVSLQRSKLSFWDHLYREAVSGYLSETIEGKTLQLFHIQSPIHEVGEWEWEGGGAEERRGQPLYRSTVYVHLLKRGPVK